MMGARMQEWITWSIVAGVAGSIVFAAWAADRQRRLRGAPLVEGEVLRRMAARAANPAPRERQRVIREALRWPHAGA